jgi:hypothetical protein
MARVTAENLQEKQAGDRMSADEYNALARNARQQYSLNRGHYEEGMIVHDRVPDARNKFVRFWSDIALPAYSVFTIQLCDFGAEHDPAKMTLALPGVGGGGSFLGAWTNEAYPIVAGSWNWGRPINDFDTAKVRYHGDTPRIGWAAGLDHGFGSLNVGKMYGFTILGVEQESENSYIRVQRTPDPHCIIARVTETVTPLVGDRMGKGRVKVLYRDGRDLVDAGVPVESPDCTGSSSGDDAATADQDAVEVYSICHGEFEVGRRVKCDQTLGIGLVVTEPCGDGGGLTPGVGSSSSGSGSGSKKVDREHLGASASGNVTLSGTYQKVPIVAKSVSMKDASRKIFDNGSNEIEINDPDIGLADFVEFSLSVNLSRLTDPQDACQNLNANYFFEVRRNGTKVIEIPFSAWWVPWINLAADPPECAGGSGPEKFNGSYTWTQAVNDDDIFTVWMLVDHLDGIDEADTWSYELDVTVDDTVEEAEFPL